MKFGPVATAEAVGAILAHSTQAGAVRLRKGHRLAAGDIAALAEAGIGEIIVARLDPGDMLEDEAAACLAAVLATETVEAQAAATGRVNLHARCDGLFVVDRAVVEAVNAVDPAITLATLANFSPVTAGRMVATVKIIPFAVSGDLVAAAAEVAGQGQALDVRPYRAARVALVQTTLPCIKPSVLDKTARTTADRLARSGSVIASETRVAHDAAAVAAAIRSAAAADMIIVFGASAVSGEDDGIPAAIRLAGGVVHRVGMPVDPGNLLVIGELGGRTVLGAPGCARSPKENGFDWVIDRLMAGLAVTDADIVAMGVGGLLMEIPTRPQPREPSGRPARPEVEAVVLAAGRSSRMGGHNKLLALFDGVPLIRRTVEAALASRARAVTVVTGHQAQRIDEALSGLDARLVYNDAFAEGLAGSLKAGIAALDPDSAGALVVLGDMPAVGAADLDRLVEAFARSKGEAIVRATHAGVRGNPVILPRSVFQALAGLTGDIGARAIVESGLAEVVDVEIGAAASLDVDTPEAMRAAGGELRD